MVGIDKRINLTNDYDNHQWVFEYEDVQIAVDFTATSDQIKEAIGILIKQARNKKITEILK